jgi:hypothetical protein
LFSYEAFFFFLFKLRNVSRANLGNICLCWMFLYICIKCSQVSRIEVAVQNSLSSFWMDTACCGRVIVVLTL